MTPVQADVYRRLAAGFPGDPVGYAAAVLGQPLTPQQQAIVAALLAPPYSVLTPSGHALGKTHLFGAAVNWHHDSFDPGVVVTTAPTADSLTKQLWKEVRRLRPFGLGLLPKANELYHTPTHFATGVTTRIASAFQGKHEANGLIVVDEADAVELAILTRARTMHKRRPGWGMLVGYNPYDPTTPPYALEQSGEYAVVRLSALDHPNLLAFARGEPPPIPGAVDAADVASRIPKECDEWGRTRPPAGGFQWPPGAGWWTPRPGTLFAPQVLGRWPDAGFDSIWSDSEWERCGGSVSIEPSWPLQLGCDVHRFGKDRTAFAVRRGPALVWLELIERWRTGRPSREIADRLRELCVRFAPAGANPKAVPCLIDDTGGYGSGVVDHPDGYSFYGVSASAAALDAARYANTRAELWYTLKLSAELGQVFVGNVPDAQWELVRQLGDELKAARGIPDRQRRRVVEGKEAMKQRLGRSPDLADAVALAWYPVPGG